MTAAGLAASYDQSIDPTIVQVVSSGASTYCVKATAPGDATKVAYKAGPSAQISTTVCT
jgi:hypothetical protein